MTDRRVTKETFDQLKEEGWDPIAVRNAKRAEEARQKRIDQRRADDEKEAKARAERREAARREKVDADEAALKADVFAKFMSLPGSRASEFDALWPTIRRAYLQEQLLGNQLKTPVEELKDELRARHAHLGAGKPE
jgi:hypothetical protein